MSSNPSPMADIPEFKHPTRTNKTGLTKYPWVIWVFIVGFLCMNVECDGTSQVSVKLIKKPELISNVDSPTFGFHVGNGGFSCNSCISSCKLDNLRPTNCSSGKVSYTKLQDGNHTFEVCTNTPHRIRCATYNWTIDTVPPTAYVTASTSFTNTTNISVYISFSEPCSGVSDGGGFRCLSANNCSLLVYGQGQVISNTLKTIKPNLEYSISVNLATNVEFGRAVLVTDKDLCKDAAGNQFIRTTGSSFLVHFDRRSVYADLRTHIPEQLVQLDNNVRTVQATNRYKNLKLYLYFTQPIVNTSAEVLKSLKVSQGSLVAATSDKDSLGSRRFGFELVDIPKIAIVTARLNSGLLLTRQGKPVSSVALVTFLFDTQRPYVRLSTTSHMRTQQERIPVAIKFTKPVFGFNSSHLSISGGRMLSFSEISKIIYAVEIQLTDDWLFVHIPENVTTDVAGNTNLASNTLQLLHYSVPAASMVLSSSATAAFALTAVVATLLTVSTASLQNYGAFATSSPLLTSSPARILFRIVCHIQIFALSGWLAVPLPIEYSEFIKGLRWSIPYFKIPWESDHVKPILSMNPHSYGFRINDHEAQITRINATNVDKIDSVYGLPLTAMEYKSFFESRTVAPEAEYITDTNDSDGWMDFKRSMFWLAVMSGGLMILHMLFPLILRLRKKKEKEKENTCVSVIFPRFEIFLVILAVPCVSAASASLLKGGSASGIAVGILVLGAIIFLLVALFMFLSVGISQGKLLQYKEVHHEDQKMHWYQTLVKVTLGPGKRGQWTWINTSNSKWLTILGPLFEDLRGPPKYMLSQITEGLDYHTSRGSIIASDDENEDAEAPFVQRVFGILRIYYIFLESVKRVVLGILVGSFSRNQFSETPTKTLLCVTSFQLFFMLLKKPFIKKKVQLVEIISVSSQVSIFLICLVLLRKNLSTHEQTKIGITMVCLFLFAFVAQILNEWNSLLCQIKQLDPNDKSLCIGLKIASWGILLLFVPIRFMKNIESQLPLKGRGCDSTAPVGRFRNSSAPEQSWMKQLRDLAKSSFSREGSSSGGGGGGDGETPTDPSSSRTKWSEFWNGMRSGSSTHTSSSDSKSIPKKMYKDFEALFGSNK